MTSRPCPVRCAYVGADRHGCTRRSRHALPDGWTDLSRSIRAAAGTALGSVAFVDLDPTADHIALAEPDGKWRDYADDYIDYLLDRVMRWAGPGLPKAQQLLAFDPWLERTGRKELAA
jgi:hypothetical protein